MKYDKYGKIKVIKYSRKDEVCMAFFDDLQKNLSAAGKQAADKAKEVADLTMKTAELRREEQELKDCYARIGQRLYESTKEVPSEADLDDFNQIEKQLRIQEIISNIKSKPANLVLDNLIVLSAVMSTINGLVFPSVILTITSLYRSIYNLQLDYSNKKNIKREIEAAVRNTDTYKICLEEYKSYLEKLS